MILREVFTHAIAYFQLMGTCSYLVNMFFLQKVSKGFVTSATIGLLLFTLIFSKSQIHSGVDQTQHIPDAALTELSAGCIQHGPNSAGRSELGPNLELFAGTTSVNS